jgi:hypothetical protein
VEGGHAAGGGGGRGGSMMAVAQNGWQQPTTGGWCAIAQDRGGWVADKWARATVMGGGGQTV